MEQHTGIQTCHNIVQHNSAAVMHLPVDNVGRWNLDDIKEPEQEKTKDNAFERKWNTCHGDKITDHFVDHYFS